MSNLMPKTNNMTISERIRKLREIFGQIKVEKEDEDVVYCGTVENDSKQVENINLKEATNEKLEKRQKCKKISKNFGDENEKEEKIEVNLDENQSKNKPEVRECRVILKDINKEIKNGMFKNVKIIKSEPERNQPFLKQNLIKNPDTKKVASKSNKIDCEFCGLKITRKCFSRHMRRIHPQILKKSSFRCQICNQNFPSSKSLKYHMSSIHPKKLIVPGNFKCDFEGKSFKLKANLLIHMNKHKMRVNCDICNAEIKPKGLNQHKAEFHPKITSNKIDCEFCGLKMLKSCLTRHIKRVHPQVLKKSPFSCQICNKNFLSSYSLKLHMNLMHLRELFVPESGTFECDYDGKLFKAKKDLHGHMKKHVSRVKCQICDIEIRNIIKHIKDVHTDDQKFQCQICQKCFKTDQILKNHISTHKKMMKCLICLKKFSSQSFLNYHIKHNHDNPRNFECNICGKKFNLKHHLQDHQKTHDKNRPKAFKCQRCDYATDESRNYKAHQKSHERQDKKFAAMKNPIKCQKCPTFCRNKETLSQHMKVVHPEVSYQCDLCGMYIKTKDHLRKHILAHLRKQNKIN